MAAAAILKNTQKGISQPILDQFVIKGPKCHFLNIQDGGGRHLGKYTKGRIWANSQLIYIKFGVLLYMGNLRVISVKKTFFGNSRWRRPPS